MLFFPGRKLPFWYTKNKFQWFWKVKNKKKKKKKKEKESPLLVLYFVTFPSFFFIFPFFPCLSFPGRSAKISCWEVSGGHCLPRLLCHWQFVDEIETNITVFVHWIIQICYRFIELYRSYSHHNLELKWGLVAYLLETVHANARASNLTLLCQCEWQVHLATQILLEF